MAEGASLQELIAKLDSIDADERFEALQAMKRYVGNRKVDQAVFELRNDGDRRVRMLARDLLAESEKRTSESLSVVGGDPKAMEERLDDLLAMLKSESPTDRVSALKELRMMDHPRAVAAVLAAKKDPNRVVRMVAEKASEDRATSSSRTSMRIDNGVMTLEAASPAEGEAARAPGGGPMVIVPILGILYLVGGLPSAVLSLWLWTASQGFLSKDLLPDPAMVTYLEQTARRPLDPLLLALVFTSSTWGAVTGVGLMMRREWGRRSAMTLHTVMVFGALFLPGLFPKIFQGFFNLGMVYLFTRPRMIESFESAADKSNSNQEPPPPSTNYGSMERKTW